MTEREKEAHTRWSTARSLVVAVARELAQSEAPAEHLSELRAVLKAEQVAREELERRLKEQAEA